MKGNNIMSVQQIIENALKCIEAEKEKAINATKERVMREKVVPNNTEIDRLRTEAINARSTKLNEDIQKLQEEFNAERQAMIEASEKKKSDFAAQVIATEVSIVSVEYDNHIHLLNKQLSEFQG